MQMGSLIVQLSVANEAAPVSKAVVSVTTADGSVYYRISDESGKTAALNLPCPDRSLSLDPACTEPVCSYVCVSVSADRFVSVTVEDVEIYAEQTTILPITLSPLAVGNGYGYLNEGKSYVLPRTAPFKGSAMDSGDEDSSGYVLGRVVVPEYITVHLGRPTAAAENVTVSFLYYIKNVCSSEIYPTWDESAIRANIYCQTSLALNRIFTEWYRSRGYDFDITNSTQYDQYFVKGRTIFENVSRIADELFCRYIRRDGFIEPLFSSYCNGTTAICDGLSQWGSQQLAQQGKTPYEILKYYYGNNIILDTAPMASGSQSSYPGSALRKGSRGSDVRVLQTQLNRIAKSYPQIPTVAVDGVFGAATERAVKAFQQIFNLTADGVVGKATWYKLSYIFVSVTRLAQLTSEGLTSSPAIPATRPTETLKKGSRGERVELAQFLLNLASAFYGGYGNVAVDGAFGSATESLTKAFQRSRGLVADGIIGQKTWAALLDVYYSVQNAISSVSPAYPGSPLRTGSSGSDVKLVQRYLNVIAGFYSGIQPTAIDGVYGSGTASSVRAFQQLFGLTPDGIVGPKTWSKLVSVYNSVMNTVEDNIPWGGRTLTLGMEGEDILTAQRIISIIAAGRCDIPLPETNGCFGPLTECSVAALRKLWSLRDGADIDEEFWCRMSDCENILIGRARAADGRWLYGECVDEIVKSVSDGSC